MKCWVFLFFTLPPAAAEEHHEHSSPFSEATKHLLSLLCVSQVAPAFKVVWYSQAKTEEGRD